MKYYQLLNDQRNDLTPTIVGLPRLDQFNKILRGETSLLPNSLLFKIMSNEMTIFPDVLNKQIFMVKDIIFDLLKLYLPQLECSLVYLSNKKYNQVYFYYIPHLPIIDFFTNEEGPIIVNKEYIPDIFIMRSSRNKYIVASLPVVESILRRNPQQILLKEITLINEVNSE